MCRTGLPLPARGAGLDGSLGWDSKEEVCALCLVTLETSFGVELAFAWRGSEKDNKNGPLRAIKKKVIKMKRNESLKTRQKKIPEQVAIQSYGKMNFQHGRKC